MRIAYVSIDDPADRHAWSGTIRGIYDALQSAGADVDVITHFGERPLTRLRTGIRKLLWRKLFGTEFPRNRDPGYFNDLARAVEKRLGSTRYDFILSPSSVTICALRTDIPIAFWGDANFDAMVDFYLEFSNLAKRGHRQGTAQEQLGLTRTDLAIYSSTWAAQTAIQHYDVDPAKVHVVGFGANLPAPPIALDMQARMASKPILLHIGVDFVRKGGAKAVAAAAALRERGIDVELHIVGTTPPGPLPDWVVLHGFLSKKDPAQWQVLADLLARARFLIVPTVAECFGIVFVEAAAFGLPSIATRVGGVPSAIEEGVTGMLMEPDATGADYADSLEPYLRDPELYAGLCQSALDAYQQRQSWEHRGRQVIDLMRQVIDARAGRA